LQKFFENSYSIFLRAISSALRVLMQAREMLQTKNNLARYG